MVLPAYITKCIDALENAGFATYCVGGCVRDALLGLIPHDYDLCTAATPDQIKAVFSGARLVLAGEKHGTVSIAQPEGLVEITTFRTEGDYADNRHPGWVAFVPDIRQDLARRDFTVNAMAYSPTRGLCDPFGGQEDLQKNILRAVGDPRQRFTEDALRILRGARFSVRYGLTPEENTLNAMKELVSLMDKLSAERVFSELCKLITLASAEDMLRFAPILTRVIPELAPTVGFDQRNPHHAYDLYTHIAYVTASVPGTLPLRFAALLHDIGKVTTFTLDEKGCGHFYGHAAESARMANDILLRLKAPTALREQVVKLITQHMTWLEPDRRLLRRWLGKLGQDGLDMLLTLQEADMGSKGTGSSGETDAFRQIRNALAEVLQEQACFTVKDLAVNGNDLIELGFAPGSAIGACLQALLQQVQDETLQNTKETLLAAASAMLPKT